MFTKLAHHLLLSTSCWKNEPAGDREEGDDLAGDGKKREDLV
jgi:hypothetical protein